MSTLGNISDPRRDARVVRLRLWWLVAFMVLAMGSVLFRLATLQFVNFKRYEVLAQDNRIRVLPVPPPRGLIHSRDGVLLADNRPGFSLVLDREKVDDIDERLAEIATLIEFNEEHRAEYERARKRTRRFDDVVVKAGLTDEEVAAFEVNGHRFPGFRVKAELVRHYPEGPLYAHLVGYVGAISESELSSVEASRYAGTSAYGKAGVERAYQDVLHGHPGLARVEVNAQGRVLRTIEREAALPGQDLYLSVDSNLQKIAREALGDRRGALVALDTQTGGVLAMVSTPSFDPNWFVQGISSKRYRSLQDPIDRPLYNRAIQGQYPPGSTVKPMVALAGLHHGLRSVGDRSWCPGYYRLPGREHRYRCWKKPGHGWLNLTDSIAQSCDVYFYELANDLGIDRMAAFLDDFGFGRPTGIDLPNESGGLLPTREWKRERRNEAWYPGETLIAGIGQGFMLATPLQLAAATLTLANHGVGIVPRAVGQVENPATMEASERPMAVHDSVAVGKERQWEAVINGMAEVMHGVRGTARASAEGASYRYAGKTGTAQLFKIAQDVDIDNDETPEHLKDHALFIALAPLEAPEIVLAVIVENGGSGSKAAAPVARTVLDLYFGDGVEAGLVFSDDGHDHDHGSGPPDFTAPATDHARDFPQLAAPEALDDDEFARLLNAQRAAPGDG